MTAADREPVPLPVRESKLAVVVPVRCPDCGRRTEVNASIGSVLAWKCRKCGQDQKVEILNRTGPAKKVA